MVSRIRTVGSANAILVNTYERRLPEPEPLIASPLSPSGRPACRGDGWWVGPQLQEPGL